MAKKHELKANDCHRCGGEREVGFVLAIDPGKLDYMRERDIMAVLLAAQRYIEAQALGTVTLGGMNAFDAEEFKFIAAALETAKDRKSRRLNAKDFKVA